MKIDWTPYKNKVQKTWRKNDSKYSAHFGGFFSVFWRSFVHFKNV